MSRAEAFVSELGEGFREVADFCSHYFMGGYDLWGNPWIGFLVVVAVVGAFVFYDLWEESSTDSPVIRIREALAPALIVSTVWAVPLWFPFNILLGYFFGPIRP